MKIQKVFTHNLRNDAHFQFHTEFRDIIASEGAEVLKVKPLFEAYLPLYARVDEAFKKISKSAFTQQINESDKARDKIWRGLVDTNAAALNHFNGKVQEAAKRLKIVFDTYGNLARKPQNEQTSAVYNILQELCGNYAVDVATVGVGEWVTELEARNIAFGNLMRERYEESAAKCNIVLKTARAELDKAYRAIIERINALIVVEGVAVYEAFVKTLNAIAGKYAVGSRRSAEK